MAPRTRATVSSASAAAPLAAAPRRRVKVTPLEKEITQPIEESTQPVTRSTRNRKPSIPVTDDQPAETKKVTTTKPRGRPKKSENVSKEPESEKPIEPAAEKSKRTTRSTRATATTASSEAKEKPAARITRGTKTGMSKALPEVHEPVEQPETEHVPVKRAATKKKVTFQDFVDDKENQPIATKGTKKSTGSKSAKQIEQVAGLRAKPVRKAVTAAATRATKRTRQHVSDDEDDKPSKIQRVLTPKKITQVARAATPDDLSEDELNGGKTSIRDLSVSPRRPQSTIMAEAVAKTLSPVKKLDFSQQMFQQSATKCTEPEPASLQSPARRLLTSVSPSKIFSQSIIASPAKVQSDANNGLASPARRPVDSPAKLLFPHATKTEQRVNLSQSSSNLFQSPKRSSIFDASRIFSHSAIKPQKINLHKSSFLSSPAKRAGLASPLKKSFTNQANATHGRASLLQDSEVDLNEIEVTELVNDDMAEITVSSHQRASVSPMRTYKLSADELQMDFDDSILPVGSPLKLAKSPVKSLNQIPNLVGQPESPVVQPDEDTTDASSVVQSIPPCASERESTFINPHLFEVEGDLEPQHTQDPDTVDAEDDTIVLSENLDQVTPRSAIVSYMNDDSSMDELAPSPEEDFVAKYMKSPTTPATLNEHELTNILTSPDSDQTPIVSRLGAVVQKPKSSPVALHENELTMMCSTQTPASKSKPTVIQAANSPASLHEHEMTMMGSSPVTTTPKAGNSQSITSPVSLYENELTIAGVTVLSSPIPQPIHDNAETTSTTGHNADLAVAAIAQTPKVAASSTSHVSSVKSKSAYEVLDEVQTPASVMEHELTLMGENSPNFQAAEDIMQTPVAVAGTATNTTPDLPIPRSFNLHTVISKVPLKPEGEESPFKLQIKKRKRPLSLGGQPGSIDIFKSITPIKSARTVSSPDATFFRKSLATTPAQSVSQQTPTSRFSSVKSGKRVSSTPVGRAPLSPVIASSVLSGAVVYVDVRTSEGADASAIYIDLLTGLGAKVLKEWKENLTHVVYKDGNPKVLEKAMLADSQVKIVGVSWPLDCEAQKAWVDETDYLLNLTSTDRVMQSVTKSARRKSMEPSTLIADGSGSIRRSRSKGRASIGSRRSIVKPQDLVDGTPSVSHVRIEDATVAATTPQISTVKKQANLDKNSLTAAWKSINASHNLGEDTPARRTLDLLQKSYQLENSWDDSIISSNSNEDENDENTPQPQSHRRQRHSSDDDDEDEILETGLTPAPYKTKMNIGSAPSKLNDGVGGMSYRQRVEEMERREMRDNAFGTNKGSRAKGGKRMTMFGFGPSQNVNL